MATAPSVRRPQRDHEVVLVRQDDRSTWEPDAAVAFNISSSWLITDHPVESGAMTSDHVQQQPDAFTITCVLSENPTQGGSVQGGPLHLQTQLSWLRDTADAGRLVDVVTRRLGTFRGYLIQSVPVAGDNVSRLRFDLGLREVRIATATTVLITVDDVADSVATGAPDEVDAGEQPTTSTSDSTEADAAAEEADQSTLAALLDAA